MICKKTMDVKLAYKKLTMALSLSSREGAVSENLPRAPSDKHRTLEQNKIT